MNLEPLNDRVVVQPIENPDKSKGGILLPAIAQDKPQTGKVIGVGPGNWHESGRRLPLSVRVGDVVLFAKYTGTEVKMMDQPTIVLRESDILAVLK